MEIKSDVFGSGYGSNHKWKNMGSKQLDYTALEEEKCTTYKCKY